MVGRRESDGIAFLPSGDYLATANEGDTGFDTFGMGEYSGGRGFTLFDLEGGVVFDAMAEMETQAVVRGHYPDDRSGNRGIEVENVASAALGGNDFLFAASERGSFVSVYQVDNAAAPSFLQFLPTGAGPEGLLPVAGREDGAVLLGTANEADGTINIFQALETAYMPPADAPVLMSASQEIPWGAISGLTTDGTYLYAVPDNAFTRSRIYRVRMDVDAGVALIDEATFLRDENMEILEVDPEGIAYTGSGFYVASEGSDPSSNILYRTDMDGGGGEPHPVSRGSRDGLRRGHDLSRV